MVSATEYLLDFAVMPDAGAGACAIAAVTLAQNNDKRKIFNIFFMKAPVELVVLQGRKTAILAREILYA